MLGLLLVSLRGYSCLFKHLLRDGSGSVNLINFFLLVGVLLNFLLLAYDAELQIVSFVLHDA